jgi:GT2 family glycosyltransferase
VGGLDEDYFLYYEDVDLCRRAIARGWSVWHDPSLRAVHHHPIHSRSVPPLLRVITRHSLLTYGARHWPRWQARVLAGIVGLEAWARKMRAWCRQDAVGTELFGALGTVARQMAHGRYHAARRRINQLLLRHEVTY